MAALFFLTAVVHPAEAQQSSAQAAPVELPASVSPYKLTPASPNPFTTHTAFRLEVAEQQHVRVEAFNMLGQRVDIVYDDIISPSFARMVTFRADDLPSGIYHLRITGDTFEASRQVTLLR